MTSDPIPAHRPAPSAPIFIIEDDRIVTRALATLLAGHGYATRIFNSGAGVLPAASETRPLAVVLDIHLPDISGLALSSQLRDRLGPHLPILIVSGDTSIETIHSLHTVGATYFLSKPLNTSHLLDRLAELTATP